VSSGNVSIGTFFQFFKFLKFYSRTHHSNLIRSFNFKIVKYFFFLFVFIFKFVTFLSFLTLIALWKNICQWDLRHLGFCFVTTTFQRLKAYWNDFNFTPCVLTSRYFSNIITDFAFSKKTTFFFRPCNCLCRQKIV
jgi:hypothetical protein